MSRFFEVAKGFEHWDVQLPERSTSSSAGYDFVALRDVTVPSVFKTFYDQFDVDVEQSGDSFGVGLVYSRSPGSYKGTMVETGVKASMNEGEYLALFSRSSSFNKSGLMLANNVGIIDKDYFENPGNDGHIQFNFINFGFEDVDIKKGEKIGQGLFQQFQITENDAATGARLGGWGSTGN